MACVLWLERDAHRTGVGAMHDFGFFLWFAWVVVIPWYSLKTRGPRGWRLCLGLFALIGSAYIGAAVAYLIRYGASYFQSAVVN